MSGEGTFTGGPVGGPEMGQMPMGRALMGRGGAKLAREASAPSYCERLYQRRVEMQGELDKVNEAIKALEDNPEVEKVIHAITKVQGLY